MLSCTDWDIWPSPIRPGWRTCWSSRGSGSRPPVLERRWPMRRSCEAAGRGAVPAGPGARGETIRRMLLEQQGAAGRRGAAAVLLTPSSQRQAIARKTGAMRRRTSTGTVGITLVKAAGGRPIGVPVGIRPTRRGPPSRPSSRRRARRGRVRDALRRDAAWDDGTRWVHVPAPVQWRGPPAARGGFGQNSSRKASLRPGLDGARPCRIASPLTPTGASRAWRRRTQRRPHAPMNGLPTGDRPRASRSPPGRRRTGAKSRPDTIEPSARIAAPDKPPAQPAEARVSDRTGIPGAICPAPGAQTG